MYTVVLLVPHLLTSRYVAGERPLIVAHVEADDPGQAVRAVLEIYELTDEHVADVLVWEGGHTHGDIAEPRRAPPPGHPHWGHVGKWGQA